MGSSGSGSIVGLARAQVPALEFLLAQGGCFRRNRHGRSIYNHCRHGLRDIGGTIGLPI